MRNKEESIPGGGSGVWSRTEHEIEKAAGKAMRHAICPQDGSAVPERAMHLQQVTVEEDSAIH